MDISTHPHKSANIEFDFPDLNSYTIALSLRRSIELLIVGLIEDALDHFTKDYEVEANGEIKLEVHRYVSHFSIGDFLKRGDLNKFGVYKFIAHILEEFLGKEKRGAIKKVLSKQGAEPWD